VKTGKRLASALLLVMLAVSVSRSARYNPFVWTTYRDFSRIYSIAMNMQEVYFGTDYGILRYNRFQNRWDEPITQSNGFAGSRAELLAFDKAFNKLWILSDRSLSLYLPSIAHWEMEIPRTSLPLQTIHSIGFSIDSVFIAGNSTVYAALRGSLAWSKRNGNLPPTIEWYGKNANISVRDFPFLTPYYASDGYFNKYEYTALAVDPRDLWLGTDGYGTFQVNPFTWNGTHYLVGIAHNRTEAVFNDGEGLWIGGQAAADRGFIHVDLVTGEGIRYRAEDIYGIESNEILAITGQGNIIWFGTSAGLVSYDKEKELWKTYSMADGLPGNIVMALQLNADTLFIGTDNGMGVLSPSSSEIVSIREFNNLSIPAFGIYSGELIIGTESGVFLKKESTFEQITDPDGDLGFGVTAIFVDSAALWFGTYRKGIEVYYPDSLAWQEFLPPTTISGDHVFAIAGRGDYVWVGTDFGVSRYHKATDSWRTFTEDDGLAHNEVFAIYVDEDVAWFGTRDGLTRLRYRDPSVPP
jgi:ligand-binding sensor domain-containing protein